MNKHYEWSKSLLVFILGATLGLLAIVVPPLFIPGIKFYEAPLFPIVRTGIEELSLWAILCLFLSGMFLGFIRPKHAWLWGLATMFLFPIFAVIEMVADPYSHNLWPIEFTLYGFMTIPGIVGAYIGAFIRRKFAKAGK